VPANDRGDDGLGLTGREYRGTATATTARLSCAAPTSATHPPEAAPASRDEPARARRARSLDLSVVSDFVGRIEGSPRRGGWTVTAVYRSLDGWERIPRTVRHATRATAGHLTVPCPSSASSGAWPRLRSASASWPPTSLRCSSRARLLAFPVDLRRSPAGGEYPHQAPHPRVGGEVISARVARSLGGGWDPDIAKNGDIYFP
jgi:hypothetical protein